MWLKSRRYWLSLQRGLWGQYPYCLELNVWIYWRTATTNDFLNSGNFIVVITAENLAGIRALIMEHRKQTVNDIYSHTEFYNDTVVRMLTENFQLSNDVHVSYVSTFRWRKECFLHYNFQWSSYKKFYYYMARFEVCDHIGRNLYFIFKPEIHHLRTVSKSAVVPTRKIRRFNFCMVKIGYY